MKPLGIVNMAAIFLVFGMPAPLQARQEKPEKQEERAKPAQQAKPEQQQGKAQQEQQLQQHPKSQENSAKQQQEVKGRQDQQRQPHPQESKPAKQPQQSQANGHQGQQRAQQQDKTAENQQVRANSQREQQDRSSERPRRTQQAIARQHAQPALRLSARGGGRISEAHFHSNFGREHRFRIGNPVLVGGYSRFQYGGYWFGFVEPWPAGWYYTDDVYIDYVDDGYYMSCPPGKVTSLVTILCFAI